MNWSSLVIAVLYGIQQEYVSAESLQVQVNGEITSDTQFCINETLTFTCTVQSSIFQWTVGSFLTGNDGVVSVGLGGSLRTETVGMFILTAEGASAPDFRSTLTVTASTGLNGIVISCFDLFLNNNQTTEVSIHGPPSLTVNAEVMGQLDDVTITLNVPNSVTLEACIRIINASLSSYSISMMSSNVERSQSLNYSTSSLIFPGLNLCYFNYNYTVKGYGIINTYSVSDDVAVPGAVLPSAPHISSINSSIVDNNLQFSLTIEPPERNVECVSEYNVSVISDVEMNTINIPINDSTTTVVFISRANVINFNPCLYNYSFQVRASNSEELSDVVKGYFDFSGYKSLSCLSQKENALQWSIPSEIATCIARLQYSLQYSKISGFLEANATTLSLNSINISTNCNVDVITITPIFHVRNDPISAASVMGVISRGDLCPAEQNLQFCKYESYIGSLVGTVVVAVVAMLIIAILICKIIKLHQKFELYKEQHTNEIKGKDDKDSSAVNMVDCQAYGTVMQPIASSTSAQTQPQASTSVYEAI